MKLLAIETSGRHCSAALLLNGEIEQRIEDASRRHGELVLGMMEELLRSAGLALTDLDALAYGRGPGSFTGVRVAAAVAQGAAFGAGLPVIGVSTLAAMASSAHRQHGATHAVCALDARMGEIYLGCFRIEVDGAVSAVVRERVIAPSLVELPTGTGWVGVGSGWEAYPELATRFAARLFRVEPSIAPEARDVAAQAAGASMIKSAQPPHLALPVYLRNRVAEASKKAS